MSNMSSNICHTCMVKLEGWRTQQCVVKLDDELPRVSNDKTASSNGLSTHLCSILWAWLLPSNPILSGSNMLTRERVPRVMPCSFIYAAGIMALSNWVLWESQTGSSHINWLTMANESPAALRCTAITTSFTHTTLLDELMNWSSLSEVGSTEKSPRS